MIILEAQCVCIIIVRCQRPCGSTRADLFPKHSSISVLPRSEDDQFQFLRSCTTGLEEEEKLKPHLERNIQHQRVNLYEVDQPTIYCSYESFDGSSVVVDIVVGPKPRSCRHHHHQSSLLLLSSKWTTSSIQTLDADFPIQQLESPAVVARGRCFRHLLIFEFIFPPLADICHHQHRRYACLRWFLFVFFGFSKDG